MLNHLGEREYQTYSGWKAACRKAAEAANGAVEFEGDRDICQAFIVTGVLGTGEGGRKGLGEWDGAVGSLYGQPVTKPVADRTTLGVDRWSLRTEAGKATAIVNRLLDETRDEFRVGDQVEMLDRRWQVTKAKGGRIYFRSLTGDPPREQSGNYLWVYDQVASGRIRKVTPVGESVQDDADRVVDKAEQFMGDVIDEEMPEAQAREECWTLCIDAANELFHGPCHRAVSAAKLACHRLGFPPKGYRAPHEPAAKAVWPPQAAGVKPAEDVKFPKLTGVTHGPYDVRNILGRP